jgi:hypothetical protein
MKTLIKIGVMLLILAVGGAVIYGISLVDPLVLVSIFIGLFLLVLLGLLYTAVSDEVDDWMYRRESMKKYKHKNRATTLKN